MAFVNVPKDLTKVKSKVAFGLTKRQLLCFSAAAVVGVLIYFLSKGIVGSAAVLFMIFVMLPFFFFAMYERDGQPAEKILKNYLRFRLWPGARPYRTENLYAYLEKEGKKLANENETAIRAGKAPAKKHAPGQRKQG